MAQDIIMQVGMVLFFILFMFLMVIFVTSIVSVFKKEKYKSYQPHVSVVIPAYNEEKTIAKCLDAVFSLSYPKDKVEVIVVDDGSTDSTPEILEKYQSKHKNVTLVRGNHEGKSISLNLGVKKAAYEIIMTVDADTFIHKNSLRRLVRPLQDPKVGATNGSCIAGNDNNMITIFQKIEYHYNNLIRKSFSVIFKNGIWFFGAFACYKKSVLEKIGYFKTDTMTEDMDTAMEIYGAGYRTVNVHDALGHTTVPDTLAHFYRQRARWWVGALQTLKKNKALFSLKESPSILFLFISQYWWSFYAFISFPLIAYQVYYWFPTTGLVDVAAYLFRWFSLAGPVYVIYKIPEWGVNFYNIFGVVSGIISIFLIVWAIYMFGDKLNMKNALGIFFYFPYTLILNSIIVISLFKLVFTRKKYFIS